MATTWAVDALVLAFVLTLGLFGCGGPQVVTLDAALSRPVTERLAWARRAPRSALSIAVSEPAARAEVACRYEDELHRYVVRLGPALVASTDALVERWALPFGGGLPAGVGERGLVTLAISSARGGCSLDRRRGVRATVELAASWRGRNRSGGLASGSLAKPVPAEWRRAT